MSRAAASLIAGVMALVLAAGAPSSALAQRAVGVGVGGHVEDGARVDEEQIGPQAPGGESFDYAADDFLSLAAWVMFDSWEDIRVGALVRYYGGYGLDRVREDQGAEEGEEEEPPIELGTLVEVGGLVEWLLDVVPGWKAVIGLGFGIPVLFPEGQLQAEIDELRDQGVAVWDVPRLGFYVAPRIGARWQFWERLAFRADFAVKAEQIFAFWTTDTVSGVAFRKETDFEAIRYELTLGAEVNF